MSEKENLKKGNQPKIIAYLVLNGIIFWCVFNGVYKLEGLAAWIAALESLGSVGMVIGPLVTLFINGLLPAHWKSVLVFLRLNDTQPGTRAFTHYMYKDDRVDTERIENNYDLPTEGGAQNKLWYKMYLKNQDEIQVHESHRSWLLFRDLTASSFILGIFFGILALFGKSTLEVMLMYLAFLSLLWILLRHVAENYAIRFVCNVLALESNKQQDNQV